MMGKQHLRQAKRMQAIGGAAAVVTLAIGLCGTAGASKQRELVPSTRLPLADLGFPGYAVALMHAGASMATVHLLDDKHALFTYSLRSLVTRLPGDSGDNQDREVAAEVVEIPNGKVLARTRWRLHDHGRYLWSVGRGVFVLRTGDELSTFAPMRGLNAGTAFERTVLRHRPGHPVLLNGSPDGQILTVELQTEERRADGDDTAKHKRTTLEFFRFDVPAEGSEPLTVKAAGAVGAPALMTLALDGDGYLWADDGPRSDWKVSFNEYEGKAQPLADVHSTCTPHLYLLSRSEFASVSCGVAQDGSGTLATYGFDGHENWEEPLNEQLQPATVVAAPEVGRFAMSRLYASGDGAPVSGLSADDTSLVQEIRVYGSESGDMLLRLQCQPAVRSPENFDLSPDGRTLAVLGSKTLDLYTLPPLTEKDRKDIEEVRAMTPPAAHGPVRLTRITRPIDPGAEDRDTPSSHRRLLTASGEAVPIPASPAESATAAPPVPKAAATGAGAVGQTAAAPLPASRRHVDAGDLAEGAAGDDNGGPRKPPTLLQPGETPEFKPKNSAPQ